MKRDAVFKGLFSLTYNVSAMGCFMSGYIEADLYSTLEKTSQKVTLSLLRLHCAVLQTPKTKTGIPAVLLQIQGRVLRFLGLAQQTLLSFTAISVRDILHHGEGNHWKLGLGV